MKKSEHWEGSYSSVVEHKLSTHKVLGSIPSTSVKKITLIASSLPEKEAPCWEGPRSPGDTSRPGCEQGGVPEEESDIKKKSQLSL